MIGCNVEQPEPQRKPEPARSIFDDCPEQVLFAFHAELQRIGSRVGLQGCLYFGNLPCDVIQVFIPREKRVLSSPQGQIIPIGCIQRELGAVFAAPELLGAGYL